MAVQVAHTRDAGPRAKGSRWKSESAQADRRDSSMLDEQVTHVFIYCHYCGYGVQAIPAGRQCPKCDKSTWETSIVRDRLLPMDTDG